VIVRALDETEFLAAGARWDALLARSRADSFFLKHAWLSAWWRRFGAVKRRLCVLELELAGETVGFAPFCVSKESAHGVLPLREVGFLGREKVTGDYLDLIAAPGLEEEVLDATLGALIERRGEWDLLRLSDLPEGCATAMRLARLADARELKLTPVPGQVCPYLPLPATWDAFLASVSGNLRSNLRRREKKLAGMGARFVDRSREGTAEALASLFALHGARWSEMKGRTGNFVDERVRAFHQEMAPTLAHAGALGLWTVEVGERAVAAIYGFKHRGRFLYYQAGFDPAWAEHGVGLALMGHAIRRCIEAGLTEFDYLRGEEEYKRRWTSRSRRTLSFAVLPPGLKAFAWRALGATKDAAKRLLRREAPAVAAANVEATS